MRGMDNAGLSAFRDETERNLALEKKYRDFKRGTVDECLMHLSLRDPSALTQLWDGRPRPDLEKDGLRVDGTGVNILPAGTGEAILALTSPEVIDYTRRKLTEFGYPGLV